LLREYATPTLTPTNRPSLLRPQFVYYENYLNAINEKFSEINNFEKYANKNYHGILSQEHYYLCWLNNFL